MLDVHQLQPTFDAVEPGLDSVDAAVDDGHVVLDRGQSHLGVGHVGGRPAHLRADLTQQLEHDVVWRVGHADNIAPNGGGRKADIRRAA